MIIRYRTTKAPKGQQTAGRGAAPAPLACYRRDARTPASQRREGNPKGVTEKSCRPFRANVYASVYRVATPACSLLPFGALVVRLRIIIFFLYDLVRFVRFLPRMGHSS